VCLPARRDLRGGVPRRREHLPVPRRLQVRPHSRRRRPAFFPPRARFTPGRR